jgi:hypothetical protein
MAKTSVDTWDPVHPANGFWLTGIPFVVISDVGVVAMEFPVFPQYTLPV